VITLHYAHHQVVYLSYVHFFSIGSSVKEKLRLQYIWKVGQTEGQTEGRTDGHGLSSTFK